VLPIHADLAVTLATLPPQGMNYEGIAECLKQPRLTQAWLERPVDPLTREPFSLSVVKRVGADER